MAEVTQVSDYIEENLKPNGLGQAETIPDTLEAVDEGVDIADLTDNELVGYVRGFLGEIVQKFIGSKKFNEETFGLYRTDDEYGAGFAVAKAKKRMPTSESYILSLEDYNEDASAPDYTDGHFYGTGFDNRFYVKDNAFTIKYSNSIEMLKKTFKNKSSVEEWKAEVQALAMNSISDANSKLAKSILRMIIKNSASDTRIINLTNKYNADRGYIETDPGYISDGTQAIKTNYDFRLFVVECLQRMPYQFLDFSKKYNDGTVETFARKDDMRTIVLEEVDSMLKFVKAGVYNPNYIDIGEVYTVNYWQNASQDLLPSISANSTHDQIVIDGGTAADTTINHVIAICMDKYVAGINSRINKTTVKPMPEQDFVTYFHHTVNKYWVDNRECAVIFTL